MNALSPSAATPGVPALIRPPRKSAEVVATPIGGLMRGPFVFGLIVIVLFFGGFGSWAALAPLDSGAIAPGVVSPDSSRQVIQHLEGGIIGEVLVREGQHVAKGELLMTLESTRAAANFSSGREQWLRLLVVRARLEALATDRETMIIPEQVESQSTPDIERFITTQQELFQTRRNTLLQQVAIFDRQIEQLDSEISSVNAENDGLTTQIGLIDEEIVDKQQLVDQQLIAKSVLFELQREQARLRGAIASNHARVAQAGQRVEETKLKLLQSEETFRDQVAQESTQVNNQIAQTDEDMVSSGDVLRRTEIFSPVDGTVLNLRNKTPGGVIRAGDPIMEVVPTDDDLIILARLAPKDLDVVSVGLKAHLSLLPFAGRNVLPLNGEVTQVAADSTLDERTGQHYYEIRVRVTAEELAKHKGFYLAPGMPADVTVVTGERTMLQYLAEPLIRSIRNAFVYD